jgi:hypothetical protein
MCRLFSAVLRGRARCLVTPVVPASSLCAPSLAMSACVPALTTQTRCARTHACTHVGTREHMQVRPSSPTRQRWRCCRLRHQVGRGAPTAADPAAAAAAAAAVDLEAVADPAAVRGQVPRVLAGPTPPLPRRLVLVLRVCVPTTRTATSENVPACRHVPACRRNVACKCRLHAGVCAHARAG